MKQNVNSLRRVTYSQVIFKAKLNHLKYLNMFLLFSNEVYQSKASHLINFSLTVQEDGNEVCRNRRRTIFR